MPQAEVAQTWVAEVWLSWEVCRGSTMYRAKAATRDEALMKAKDAAAQLDALLPRSYADTDWRGRPCRQPYGFAIKHGVREASAQELVEGVRPIWTTDMPGAASFTGEHPDDHPLFNSLETRK